MTVSLIGSTSAVGYTTTGNPMSVTYASTAGSTLLFVASSNDATGMSLTDSASNTWTLVHDNGGEGGTAQKHLIAYACTGAKAIASLTWMAGADTNTAYTLAELSPSTVASSAGAVGSVPAVTGDLTVIAAGQYNAANYTENTGWTQLAYVDGTGNGGYALNAAHGGTGAPWSNTGSFGYVAVGLDEAAATPTYTHYLMSGGSWVPSTRTIL